MTAVGFLRRAVAHFAAFGIRIERRVWRGVYAESGFGSTGDSSLWVSV